MVDSISSVHAPLPRSVMIELTNHCQLACITCPRDKKDAHDYELGMISSDNFKTIFSQFENSLHTLDLTGLGESLMHPEIFDIIRWVRKQQKIHIYLTTNTILLNSATIANLAQNPVDTLCISVDGVTDAQLKSIRGIPLKQLRERVGRAVAALGDVSEFIFCTVLVEENLADMPKFVEIAASLGIRRMSLKPINLVATDIPADYYRIFRTRQYADLAAQSLAAGKELGIEVQVFNIGAYQCTFPWEPVYITWDGYLVPCCAKPFPKRKNFGNLLQQSIRKLINCDELVDFRRQLIAPADAPAFCGKCHIMEKTLFPDGVHNTAFNILT